MILILGELKADIINRLGGGPTNAQGVFWAYAFEVRWAPSQQRETDTKKIAVWHATLQVFGRLVRTILCWIGWAISESKGIKKLKYKIQNSSTRYALSKENIKKKN